MPTIRTTAATAPMAATRTGRFRFIILAAVPRLISIPSDRARATNLCVIPEGNLALRSFRGKHRKALSADLGKVICQAATAGAAFEVSLKIRQIGLRCLPAGG